MKVMYRLQKNLCQPPAVTLHSDASSLGWGAHMRDQSTGGIGQLMKLSIT